MFLLFFESEEVGNVEGVEFEEVCGDDVGFAGEFSVPFLVEEGGFDETFVFEQKGMEGPEDLSCLS